MKMNLKALLLASAFILSAGNSYAESHTTPCYFKQVGGKSLIIDSGCTLEVKSGGTFQVDAGASQISSNSTVTATTELDKTSDATLANVVGLVQTVVPGTYKFSIHLAGTAGASGGWKVAFNYTTAVLSSIESTGYAYTASAVAVTHTTTTTTQTSLIATTAANIAGDIEGTMVVTTGGTVQLQFAQNASNGSASSIYVGSYMQLTRIN